MEQPNRTLEWYSQQIEIDPLNMGFIANRSTFLTVEGKLDEAISDCSKLILLEPSRQFYVNRSRLLQKKEKYSEALKDLEEASKLEKSEADTATDIFLENSLCMKNIDKVEEMAKLIERPEVQDSSKYKKLINQILEIKDIEIQKLKSQNNKKLVELKEYYNEQFKDLQGLFTNQYNELKQLVQHKYTNYQSKFREELDGMKLEPQEKEKLSLYFDYLSSEMEKYYIAAKNLHKIEDKTIKFEDFQNMIMQKNRPDLVHKVYKFFDKYSSQIQKVQTLIKNIPYIGGVFQVIKTTMKAKGWVEEINIDNQCHNIERVAANTTSFNDFSTNLAYYLVRHYQQAILQPHEEHKSGWEQLMLKIKAIKHDNLGVTSYKTKISEEEQKVRDYAIIHASIIMVAYACNKLNFDSQKLILLNKLEASSPKQANEILAPLTNTIDEVEQSLKNKSTNKLEVKIEINNAKFACQIY